MDSINLGPAYSVQTGQAVEQPKPVICWQPFPKPQVLGEAISRFCHHWFGEVLKAKKPEENFCISPASAAFALQMCYAAAEGKTKDEMAAVLHVTPDVAQLCKEVWLLNAGLTHNDILKIANRLFVMQGNELDETFAERASKHFGAEPGMVDFAQSAAASAEINQWVSDKTNARITDLVPSDAVDDSTRTVLVNAVYLLAKWKMEFDAEMTNEEGEFFVSPGKTVTAPLMHTTEYFSVGQDEHCQFIVLPYAEEKEQVRDLEMMVFLPHDKNGLDALAAEFTHDYVAQCRSAVVDREVVLDLPRFELRDTVELKDALIAMGMPTAFSDDAEFKMVKDTHVEISRVIQQTFMKVNEEGTEAAAATAVVMMTESCCAGEQPFPVRFRADHPFLLVVRDRISDTPLFVARMVNPETPKA